MDDRIISMFALALMPLAAIGAAGQSAPVDQQQPLINTEAQLVIGIGGASQQKLAQVVTAGRSGTLVDVALAVGCASDAALTLQIQGVSADMPDGVVRTSYLFNDVGVFSIPPTFKKLSLSNPLHFAAGDRFALVLGTAPATAECSTYPGPLGNPYPGGDGFFEVLANPPGWVLLNEGSTAIFGVDLPFQTFVAPDSAPATVPALSTWVAVSLVALIAAAPFFRRRTRALV